MDLQKLNVKFFVSRSGDIRLTAFIEIFNRWIRSAAGAYYDLADYSHMRDGPGIVLIAHEENISIDENGGRLGLLYNRKQPLGGSNREKLLSAFGAAVAYCRKIEEEPALGGQFQFGASEALFIVNDRLLAPNDEATLSALKPDLEDLARSLFGGPDFTIQPGADPGQRFNVRLHTPRALGMKSLLENLRGAGNSRTPLPFERPAG